jgi:peptidoglycan/xylan/chitin deacetylase (PgdA/CDA1 family)
MFPLLVLVGLLGLVGLAYARALWTESRSDRTLALLYHRLVSGEEFERLPPLARNFAIPETRFREHLEYLRRAGYTPVSIDAVVEAVEKRTPLPARPVLITFDDGCESVHGRALPILRELGFPAVFFVTTDPDSWVFKEGPGAQRRVTEAEIRELDAGGVTIGSHALSHNALQAMTTAEIDRELGESKRYLEEVLGKAVRYFGVPLNWYGAKVRESAIRLGYRAVCTSDTGAILPDSDPFHLRRLNVEGWMSPADLENQLRPSTVVQRRIIAFFKRFPARLIGPRIWLPFRRWLFATPLGPLLTLGNLRRILIGGTLAALVLAAVLAVRLVG